MTTPLLEVNALHRWFPLSRPWPWNPRRMLRAVDGVSFHIHPGETLGLVGESGCGKSTIGRLVAALDRPTNGSVTFGGTDVHAALFERHNPKLRRQIQMVFQDPYSSLNPRMTVFETLEEPLSLQSAAPSQSERQRQIAAVLDRVGILPEQAYRFPNEFSGGQRQRIGIARALIHNPSLIVCDEPVSALDVSMQAQIINLLQDLQTEHGFSYLFIAHDLTVVRHISHRIAVMYLGSLLEIGPSAKVHTHPLHPYTQALLAAVPRLSAATPPPPILTDELPDPANPPEGCKFHTRCPQVMDCCSHTVPACYSIDDRQIACHLYANRPAP